MLRLRSCWLLLFFLGCAEDDGLQPGRETLRFEPAQGTVLLEAYETLDFRAVTTRGTVVPARWTLSGAELGVQASFRFVGATAGDYTLLAIAPFDGIDYQAAWLLRVSSQSSSITPPVSTLAAVPGAIPGSVQMTWERPAASLSQVPLSEFELYIAASDFAEAELPQMSPIVRPIDANQIQQTWRIEGLPERQNHFVRIRVVDVLNRSSALSPSVQSESTGHFDLSGSVEKLAPGVAATKGPGILIELGPHKVVTDQFGTFAFLGLPDLLREPLLVAEESGVAYYEYRSVSNWPALTQSVDVTLFVTDVVFIDDGNSGGGFPDAVTSLEFARWMTHNANVPAGTPQTVYKWQDYPIDVYAEPYVFQGVELVDYGLAVQRAVAAWNAKVGEELLRIVASPPSVGVECVAGGLSNGSLLGETIQLAPAGGLFESIPERMEVRVRPNFSLQETADRIIAHELGHVLMLNHSPSDTHLMAAGAGASGGDWPHRDEAFVARLVRHLPQQLDLRVYRDPSGKQDLLMPPLPNAGWCGATPLRFGRAN